MKIRFTPLFTICIIILMLISGCTIQKPDVKEAIAPAFPTVEREFRAAWIATVANINWPSKRGLSTAEQQKEAIALLDLLKDHNFNAAIFQVRPQCDALYPSKLEPWSYYLTGQQGLAPEPYYDPLEFWIDEAHKRGIELHVWLNPYRAHHVAGGEVSEYSIVKKRPELVVKLSSGYYWLDPANPLTQDHSYNVVMDIVKRYDVDGVHFDDYFYPYPSYNGNQDFPDDKSWQAYQQKGGKLSRGDWRRKAVNTFIERVYKGIKKEKPYVKFGVSPFGIWRPNHPASIRGFDQYNQLYADAKLWLNKGWIDYWTPQLYWPVNQIPQSYPVLLGWWDQENSHKRHIWPGMSIGRYQGEKAVDEVINQIMITRGIVPEDPGNVHWSIAPLVNSERLVKSILKGPYKQQALVPASPWLDSTPPKEPSVKTLVHNDSLKIAFSHTNPDDVFHWIVYYKHDNAWKYKILSAQQRTCGVPLFVLKNPDMHRDSLNAENLKTAFSPITQVYVSAVDRTGNESTPVPILLPDISLAQIQSIDSFFPKSQADFQFPFLADDYEAHKICDVPLRQLKCRHVVEMLQQLKTNFPQSFQYEKIGESVQGRPIHLVRMGSGQTKILLWSQMHGDEPTATGALLDIFNYLLQNVQTQFVQNILKNTTILAVPMLNPDGAEKFSRRNAQGIDINRDARDLQSPEAQLLFGLKEKYQPDFGFNLHDQGPRNTVDKTNKQAAIALMAPPFDARNRDNPTRIRAKKITHVIQQALSPYLEGHLSKYKADYMPRSFGDSMMNWGVSTVLLESGGWHENRYPFLQKMNFIALLTCMHAIAGGSYEQADALAYDDLPENGRNQFDLLIQNITVIDGTGIPPYRVDIGINYSDDTGVIVDIGDLDVHAAEDTLDGNKFVLSPGLVGIVQNAEISDRAIAEKTDAMVKNGFTTVLFSVDSHNIRRFKQAAAAINAPVNIGAILHVNRRLRTSADTLQTLRYLECGMIGLVGGSHTISSNSSARFLNKPVVPFSEINQSSEISSLNAQTIKTLSSDQTTQWKIPKRGKIRRGQIADFVLYASKPDSRPKVHSVYVKGRCVWQQGELLETKAKGERWLP